MRLSAIAPALVGWACILFGCATAVDDSSGLEVKDGGHLGDTSHVTTDGADDTTVSTTDSGSTSRDSTTSPFDTGTTIDDTGSTGADTTIDFDTGTPPFDSGTGIDTTPPPDTGTGGCTTDTDCTFPYNCCDLTSGNCSIYFGPICLPA